MAQERVIQRRASRLSLWRREIRIPFLTATIVPILLGTMVAWARQGTLDWPLFVLAMVGGLLLHVGTNVINDYFDHRSGTDARNTEFVRPYGGGSRMIQLRLMTPREVLTGAIVAYAGATLVGVALLALLGLPIVYFGLAGLASGVLYTVWLVRIGVGEIFVGLNFGVLMTLGAYYVQTRSFSTEAVAVSIPIALLIALVLFINQFQDYQADKAVGKNHLVVRLGRRRSAGLFVALLIGTYLALLAAVVIAGASPFALFALATAPLAWKAIRTALRYHDDYLRLAPANQATIMVHMLFGLLATAGYALQGAIS